MHDIKAMSHKQTLLIWEIKKYWSLLSHILFNCILFYFFHNLAWDVSPVYILVTVLSFWSFFFFCRSLNTFRSLRSLISKVLSTFTTYFSHNHNTSLTSKIPKGPLIIVIVSEHWPKNGADLWDKWCWHVPVSSIIYELAEYNTRQWYFCQESYFLLLLSLESQLTYRPSLRATPPFTLLVDASDSMVC